DWCVFKELGPASGWWRDRCQGPVLVEHPDKPGAKALHVRRPDERDPDAAIWNFPNGRTGSVTIRLQLQSGFAGANIALHNRFFNPGDPDGIRLAMFNLAIPSDGNIGLGQRIEPGRMCELLLAWNLTQHRCDVHLDGQWVVSLPLLNQTDNGISYLRLGSAAQHPDTAGFLIESVAAGVTEPKTLPIDLMEGAAGQ
ncbi:MAG: hypothetical protein IT364_11750, partial [Candidatus Hydrogenedentes bacterium]|nr:hypothetical protein [Candidatus Hydrogenedentota bacterium]